MATTRRVWVVEEIMLENGDVAQRQTLGTLSIEDDGNWQWVRPDERLAPEQQAEWDRVMGKLADVGGEDLRHIACFAGLMDHCNGQ